MTEDGVGDLQDAVDLLHFGAVEVELFDDVVPFPLIVDGIREPTLTPRGDLLHLAPIRLDQLADLFDLLLDLLVIKLRLDDIHQFVRRHTLPPFPWICSDYGLTAAAEQESARKSTKPAASHLPANDVDDACDLLDVWPIMVTMQLPQTSAHARRWASTSFADHSSRAGVVCN